MPNTRLFHTKIQSLDTHRFSEKNRYLRGWSKIVIPTQSQKSGRPLKTGIFLKIAQY